MSCFELKKFCIIRCNFCMLISTKSQFTLLKTSLYQQIPLIIFDLKGGPTLDRRYIDANGARVLRKLFKYFVISALRRVRRKFRKFSLQSNRLRLLVARSVKCNTSNPGSFGSKLPNFRDGQRFQTAGALIIGLKHFRGTEDRCNYFAINHEDYRL